MRLTVLVLLFAVAFSVASEGQLLPLGAEFQVNTYTTFSQYNRFAQGLALDSSGNFVVVWDSYGQDGDNFGVFGQRFANSGSAIGSEFQINSTTSDAQFEASVAAWSGGDFVVVWSDHGHPGAYWEVSGQRYASDGQALGTEFQVNSHTTDDQKFPAVAIGPNGDFVVAWHSNLQDGDSYGVFGQRFTSTGQVVGTEFQVNGSTTSDQRRPSVAVAATGAFVIVWHDDYNEGSDYGIFGQLFDSNGLKVGAEFQVNTYTTYDQRRPSVGMDASGGFVIVWHDISQDGDAYGIFAQRFSSTATKVGSEFQVNTYTTDTQDLPSLDVQPNGDFVITWDSVQDGHGYGIFGQRFASTGLPVGGEFQINTYTTYSQDVPVVRVTSNGNFVVAWRSYDQDGSVGGVFGQRFGIPTPTSTTTATITSTSTPASTGTATATPTPTAGNSATCPAAPAVNCAVPTSGKLIVKDNADDAKDKLIWKFGKGPQVALGDLGDPVTTSGYAFCVYDGSALKLDLTIPAGTPWEALSTKGYQYKDSAGGNDGVTKVKLLSGAAGKSKLQLKGKGVGLGVPAPASVTQLFSGMAVVAQLHGNGSCWETSFTPAESKHKLNNYKGKF